MKLLSLEGKGLLISVGITIIMCGAITYYCHMRVKNVEVALMKQNQVLTSFITNVQNEIRKGSLNNSKPVDLSTPEAREAVKNIENKKIEVSDDEADSDSDSDSESSESGSDSDSDSESESTCEMASKAGASEAGASEAGASTCETASKAGADKDASKIKVLNLIKDDLKFIDTHDNFIDFHLKMNHFVNDINTNSKIIELTDLEEITDFTIRHESDEDSDDDSDADSLSDGVSDSNSVSVSVSDSNSVSVSVSNSNSVKDIESVSISDNKSKSNKQEFKKIVLTETIVDVKEELDNTKIEEINLDAEIESSDFIKKIVKTEDKEKTSNINKMKIDDLREKVILSGLGTVESVKKLKKTDLITLLTNKE
jgi:hypothetical protein